LWFNSVVWVAFVVSDVKSVLSSCVGVGRYLQAGFSTSLLPKTLLFTQEDLLALLQLWVLVKLDALWSPVCRVMYYHVSESGGKCRARYITSLLPKTGLHTAGLTSTAAGALQDGAVRLLLLFLVLGSAPACCPRRWFSHRKTYLRSCRYGWWFNSVVWVAFAVAVALMSA
jgi:hypothetical protein